METWGRVYTRAPSRDAARSTPPQSATGIIAFVATWKIHYAPKSQRAKYGYGSFRVKSPKITENLNPTVSDFNETWYTCCLGTRSTKSKILGESDQWCGRYGPPNFESFGKNVRGCQPLNPHISGTSDPIFIKLVLMDRQFDKDSKYVILVQIGECLGALTFRPLLWPWNWPCGSCDF